MSLLDLSKTQDFCIHEITQIVMVPEYKNIILVIF